MNELILKKLIKRIKERKFDKIQVGKKKMMGMILSKADWKAYRKFVPDIFFRDYLNDLMWFRGYPLKQKQ